MPSSDIQALSAVDAALADLDDAARRRVINWVIDQYDLDVKKARGKQDGRGVLDEVDEDGVGDVVGDPASFPEFADLFYACGPPKSDADRALVAGYWVQVEQASPNFYSQTLNDLLKDLGYPIGNVTRALDNLQGRKPSLVMQLKKAGSARQARKTMKLTNEGMKAVRKMMEGE